ncbi:Mu transposase C-terminal domain-containing protein [Chryseobacterium sp. MEBOG07]|uniref:Mu transposase C-terminal domain-containing protein n=1 Tax=Chryseobacterium sp. MEBOG07 TaxID=2879939 RepID=UPI001EFFB51C|nr:Mu transposase C-terminal domain-containing protein [Chryseobacterium sp. MEBOG07]UKB79553.1 DDE-type integrase/transposase/recombinase [Chryseobacterium sp. MEBOG07]
MRYGAKVAKDKFAPLRGSFPHANTPLSVVQIDHTPVDIILVDEVFRNPFNRPHLTLAIDVFSRMIVGLHLSFDPPGAAGTGICISNSILPKEMYLEKLSISGEWPCWGVMQTIHVDNAKEFRGNMLRRACENYNINLEFRPPATPEYGGHIERLLGTLSKKIHDLPGTTFSNPQQKSTYKSEKHASFTLEEFEKWLVTYIVNVYHKQIHSGIGMSPEKKYQIGIEGDETTIGTGIPPRLLNERKIRLDFMPYYERTIQKYGIIIDHIYYYSDVLKNYINIKNNKSSVSPKYIFRRNPKDISTVYFYDPETNEYYDIPYRNSTYPPISIWEYRAAIENLKKQNINDIDEQSIFDAYQKLEELEIKSINSTKKMNKKSRRILSKKFNTNNDFLDEIIKGIEPPTSKQSPQKEQPRYTDYSYLKPNVNLDDEAFNS